MAQKHLSELLLAAPEIQPRVPRRTVSNSHGSSTAWRLSYAPLVAVTFFDRLQVVAMAVE
jgi:hypothetical protein